MQNESVPVTIPPDVQQRHEREAKDKIAGDKDLPDDVFIRSVAFVYYLAAARSEYTRMAADDEQYIADIHREVDNVRAERDQLRAELETERARNLDLLGLLEKTEMRLLERIDELKAEVAAMRG